MKALLLVVLVVLFGISGCQSRPTCGVEPGSADDRPVTVRECSYRGCTNHVVDPTQPCPSREAP